MVYRGTPHIQLNDLFVLSRLHRFGSWAGIKDTKITNLWADRIIENVEMFTTFKLFDRRKASVLSVTLRGASFLTACTHVYDESKNVEKIAAPFAIFEGSIRGLRLDDIIASEDYRSAQLTELVKVGKWLGFNLVHADIHSRTPTKAYKVVLPYLGNLSNSIRSLYDLTDELKGVQ